MRNIFSKLAIINLWLIAFILPYGALVRLTESGLSCPDWPLCYGQVVPAFDLQIFFEVSHRYIATTIGIIAVILFGISVFSKKHRHLLALSALLLFSVIIQGVLGGLTVLLGLASWTVAAHLVFGNFCLWVMVLLWMKAAGKKYPKLERFTKPVVVLTLLFLATIILGGLNSGTFAGLTCPFFPLCSAQAPGLTWVNGFFGWHQPMGDVVWFQPYLLQTFQLLHRLLAFVLLGFAGYYSAKVRKSGIKFTEFKLINITIAVQFIVGIINAITAVPIFVSLLHSILATALTFFLARAYFKVNNG